MTSDLIEAYRGTRYTVLDADGIVVAEARIDELAPDVDALLDAHGAAAGVFITAWNPRSEPTDDAVNAEAHARLVTHFEETGHVVMPHAGVGQDATWAPEHGLFVLDLSEDDATEVAASYGQNAVVTIERGHPAALVLTGVMSS